MRGERIDVAAVDACEQFLIGEALAELLLAVVSADKEAATAARRVENIGVALANTKGIDDIYNRFVSVVLTELVPLFGADELLKNVSENIGRNFLEIKLVNRVDCPVPSFKRISAGQGHERRPFLIIVGEKDGFIIAGL